MASLGNVNQSQDHNRTILESSIGLLTFVAVFYSFVLRKDILEGIEKLRDAELDSEAPEIKEILEKISKEFTGGKRPKYKSVQKYLTDLSERTQSLELSENETDMNSHLFWSVISFTTAIALTILDLTLHTCS